MALFTEYIQPFNHWLTVHPNWSSAITFFVAFSESLAIIGALIPGSLTMTILGILAGSGVIPLENTLIAAILGAMAGDAASYFLGYFFSERISSLWPFNRYPAWLHYGKSFFNKHGGKSVLLGRFVGPFRSIIPLIAGMMHMPQGRFLLANFLSAIGWSILYIMPGVLIGAASSELSAESSTKLILLVLFFIAGLWLFSIIIKKLTTRVHNFLKIRLHKLWLKASHHPFFSNLIKTITPKGEANHSATAFLFIGFLLTGFLFLFVTLTIIFITGLIAINKPVFLFLQSIRTGFFDSLFVFCNAIQHPDTLLLFGLFISFILIFQKNWRTLLYWCGLNLTCLLLIFISEHWVLSPYPQDLVQIKTHNSFPSGGITLATAQFFSLLFYFKNNAHLKALCVFLTLLLALASFSQIYLGEQWILDIIGGFLAGLCITFFYGLYFRKTNRDYPLSTSLIVTILSALVLFSFFSSWKHYEQTLMNHRPDLRHYYYTDKLWWDQKTPLLPLYRKNRVGKPVELFNVQYLGSLQRLELALLRAGWLKQEKNGFYPIIHRLTGSATSLESPILAELFLYQKPVLIMTYKKNHEEPLLTLKFWQSNYYLKPLNHPIWLGSVRFKIKSKEANNAVYSSPLTTLSAALPQFIKKERVLPLKPATALSIKIAPALLLIREKPNN